MFRWRGALLNVKPDTLVRWHRKGFRLFWRWKSKQTGRPRLPKDIRDLVRRMAAENPTWGEERIANELKLKLGIRVSPRTVGKYLTSRGPRREPDPKQRWLTFFRNHAQAIVACDFFGVVTAGFRTPYVFVILELGTRKILHHNVTAHPTVEWTLQQFREGLPGGHPYRFVIHDRDSIFSKDLDKGVEAMGVRVLRTPVRAPKANSVCERLGGTWTTGPRRRCSAVPAEEAAMPPHHKEHVAVTSSTTARLASLPRQFLVSDVPHSFEITPAVRPERDECVRSFNARYLLDVSRHQVGQIVVMAHAHDGDEVMRSSNGIGFRHARQVNQRLRHLRRAALRRTYQNDGSCHTSPLLY
jgi:hypothetical protein